MPKTIVTPAHNELLIKKSRFIACIQPVNDRSEAQKLVAELRIQHPGAAHVCWALLAGGHSAAVDDGEPSGTAGRPMLDVLRHKDLDGVLATVVRYFGGIRLGAGGLVRAYTDSVAQALAKAELIEVIEQRHLQCAIPYALEGLLRREIELSGAKLTDISHGDSVRLAFSLPASAATSLLTRLAESGQGKIDWLGTEK